MKKWSFHWLALTLGALALGLTAIAVLVCQRLAETAAPAASHPDLLAWLVLPAYLGLLLVELWMVFRNG